MIAPLARWQKMFSKREKRLNLNSSKLEFVKSEKEKASSKRCFVRSVVALGLSLAAISVIVVVTVVWFRTSPSSDKSAEDDHDTRCSFSEEARRVGLVQFLQKLRSEFEKNHPYMIASKPDVTSSEVRQVYRPYDFRPEAIKNRTDTSNALYNELQTIVYANVNERELKLRESKAMHVAKSILKVAFGWSPYEGNYYSGDWLLGPNFFCWQPICYLLTNLASCLPHFKPASVSDMQKLLHLLRQHNSTIQQYKENLRSAVKVGMVRPVEACKVGVREFKKRFLSIAVSNESGKQGILILTSLHIVYFHYLYLLYPSFGRLTLPLQCFLKVSLILLVLTFLAKYHLQWKMFDCSR